MGKHHKLDKSTSSRQADAINTGAESLTKGSKVWLRGKGAHAWEAAELRSVENGIAQVVLDKGGKSLSLPIAELVPANPRLQEGIPDLTHLSYLNEPGILYNLFHRYSADDIYTFAGPVLIAVNPCKTLPLYTSEVANAYKAGARDVVHSANMAPHIYLVAANAFRRMLREKTSQSLIVNGESGAGKTETTKKAMQYFATLAGGTGVEDQVLETNPILEAFGNAKTLRNHNSSRFGKLIQIHFNQGHHICGAAIKTYLLEKSRVVHQLKGERSYHIFYQLVRGTSKAQKAELRLPDHPTGFKFLANSGCTDIEGVNDAQEFKDVCKALTDVGIDVDQQAALFRMLAGVLWLGNLEFIDDPSDRANDATLVARDAACEACCDLLGVTPEALNQALTRKRIVTPGEIITKLLNKEENRDCRDALAKALYAAAFDWIVACINQKLDNGKAKAGSGLSIAILDIYGFEQFQKNSFEQLCINYANERLQQQFTRHLFTLEQQEYESEGIDWTKVEFIDNQECVDAIEAQPPKALGILAVLDSQCRVPKATDEGFVRNLTDALGKHPHFETNPRQPQDFTMIHYAGAVTYNCAGFLDKNRDTLNQDLIELMIASNVEQSPLVSALGRAVKEELENNAKRGGQTVGGRFSAQLRELITELDATGLHFVRCIKPNSSLKPHLWEEGMALHQLRCCGVLEVARIARAGYPTRYTHQMFAERYAILLPREQQAALALASKSRPRGSYGGAAGEEATPGAMAASQALLDMFRLSSDQYQVGRTKIFFRPGVLGFVEDKWASMQSSSVKIQSAWRMYRARSAFLLVRKSAIAFQSSWRTIQEKRNYDVLKIQTRAARVIQTRWRGYNARRKFLRKQRAALVIQMAWRRSRFGKKVKRRVFDRQKRDMMARLEQDKFDSVRQEYNCDMDEVRAALAAWKEAREAAGGDEAGLDMAAVIAGAHAKRTAALTGADGTRDLQEDGDVGADGVSRQGQLCRNCRKIMTEEDDQDENGDGSMGAATAGALGAAAGAAGGALAGLAVGRSVSATSTPRIRSTRPSGDFGSAAGSPTYAATRFTATQEAKEAAEKLKLENMRLDKQLQLERSLKDRYQRKYEDQNGLWVGQIQVLQQYIQEVRTAFGGARLPPLPAALISVVGPTGSGSGGGAPEGAVLDKIRSFGGGSGLASADNPSTPLHGESYPDFSPAPAASLTAASHDTEEPVITRRQFPRPGEDTRTAASRAVNAYPTPGGWNEEGSDSLPRSGRRPALGIEMPGAESMRMREMDPDYMSSPSRPVALPPARTYSNNSGGQSMMRGEGGLVRSRPVTVGRPTGDPASKYVQQIDTEFQTVQQVLDDDVRFVTQVARGEERGQHVVNMDPAKEINRIKQKFELWRKEFKDKLNTADEVVKGIERQRGLGGSGGQSMNGRANGHYAGHYATDAAPEPKKAGFSVTGLFKAKK